MTTAGSYRDRHSSVRLEGDSFVRSFSNEGAAWFLAAHDAGLLAALVEDGLLHPFEIRSHEPLHVTSRRIPFVSYPYEWTGTMLRDAALVTLEIARRCWDEGFHLRDASAFNVVFHGGRPVLVDHGSIRPGHTPYFMAYGQFCDHFLNPLVLADRTDLPSLAGWRSLEGLPAGTLHRMVGSRRLFRRGLVRHVWARARLDAAGSSFDAGDRRALRDDFGLSPAAIGRVITGLSQVVEGLDVEASGVWEEYESTKSYSSGENDAKKHFVSAVAERSPGRLAIDIGANAGEFSALLAPFFETVVAVEPDGGAAQVLYRRVTDGELRACVVPVVADIVDPTPARGYLNRERPGLLDRLAGADLVVWLAVLHHLVIGRNVPYPLLFELAASLGGHHVVEHVAPDDPMSQLLLASREEEPWPADQATFESAVGERFVVVDKQSVSETRTLYELRVR